jgi:hypothetical protein
MDTESGSTTLPLDEVPVSMTPGSSRTNLKDYKVDDELDVSATPGMAEFSTENASWRISRGNEQSEPVNTTIVSGDGEESAVTVKISAEHHGLIRTVSHSEQILFPLNERLRRGAEKAAERSDEDGGPEYEMIVHRSHDAIGLKRIEEENQ